MKGIGGGRALQLLQESVMKLSAHAGYQTANISAVKLLTDATRSESYHKFIDFELSLSQPRWDETQQILVSPR